MILKINKLHGTWLYFSNVERVEVSRLKHHALAFKKDCCPVRGWELECYTIMEDKTINRHSIMDYNELLFDKDVLVHQLTPVTEKTDTSTFPDRPSTVQLLHPEDLEKRWGCILLNITLKNGEKHIGIALNSQVIYLMNDEGKTIEKLN